jgi:hypothetical protein
MLFHVPLASESTAVFSCFFAKFLEFLVKFFCILPSTLIYSLMILPASWEYCIYRSDFNSKVPDPDTVGSRLTVL